MAPRRIDQDARRAEILESAMRVFARKGFAATRIEDVAAEAGIGKGSVYLYFDSRDALLDAAFDALVTASEAILHAARTGPEPPLDRLATLVRSVLVMAAARPELSRLMLDLWTVGRGASDLPLEMSRIYRRYRTVVGALLADAAASGHVRSGLGEPEATVLVGAIEGCLLQWVVDPQVPITELGGSIVAVCLDGLRGDGAR